MNDIKIKVKKSELEYCFKADNYDEFHRRFNQLEDILYQRFINELTKINKRFGIAKRGNSK